MCVCVCVFSYSVMSDSLWPHGLARLLCPWNVPGKSTGVSCPFLLQGIFLIQELNLHLLYLLQVEYLPLHQDIINCFFFISFFSLKHSWFTRLCQSLLYSKVTQLYTYIHSFLSYFPLQFITGYWIQFLGLYSRTLLFIHFIYNGLHQLIPLSHPFLPDPLLVGHRSILYAYEPVSVLQASEDVIFTLHTRRLHLRKVRYILMFIHQLSVVSEYEPTRPSLVAQMVKNLPVNAGDPGSIPGSRRSPEEGNVYPLQHSCLEKPMDRGPWAEVSCGGGGQATVHGVAKSQTQLSN